jgi:hypothetical protein
VNNWSDGRIVATMSAGLFLLIAACACGAWWERHRAPCSWFVGDAWTRVPVRCLGELGVPR